MLHDRGMNHMSKIFYFAISTSSANVIQTPLVLNIWLQSCVRIVCENSQNNIKQKNWDSFFANISNEISTTSDSLPLIMPHISFKCEDDKITSNSFKTRRKQRGTPQLTSFALSHMLTSAQKFAIESEIVLP